MQIDTIIKDGLAAMTDDAEFRRWLGKFNCVNDADCPEIEGAVWIDGFDGSLAELAFELKDKAQRDKTDRHDIAIKAMADDSVGSYNSYIGSKVWLWLKNDPALEIIVAIAALEGEKD